MTVVAGSAASAVQPVDRGRPLSGACLRDSEIRPRDGTAVCGVAENRRIRDPCRGSRPHRAERDAGIEASARKESLFLLEQEAGRRVIVREAQAAGVAGDLRKTRRFSGFSVTCLKMRPFPKPRCAPFTTPTRRWSAAPRSIRFPASSARCCSKQTRGGGPEPYRRASETPGRLRQRGVGQVSVRPGAGQPGR